jgi:hypothetical protein
MNFKTETLSVPNWSYGHSDWKYIKNIHSQFGKVKLKNYPHFSLFDTFYFLFFKRIKLISILNYIDYNKDEVMGVLENELDWKYYGGKHYESVYTRFYQAYILPKKFNIDKRLGHLSDLIRSGNITRSIALLEFNKSIADNSLLMSDKAFVMKKLCLDESAFEKIMTSQKKYFTDYPNNYNMILLLKDILNRFRSKGIMSR